MPVCVIHINAGNLTFKRKFVFSMNHRAVPGTPAGIEAMMMMMMMMITMMTMEKTTKKKKGSSH